VSDEFQRYIFAHRICLIKPSLSSVCIVLYFFASRREGRRYRVFNSETRASMACCTFLHAHSIALRSRMLFAVESSFVTFCRSIARMLFRGSVVAGSPHTSSLSDFIVYFFYLSRVFVC